MTVLLPLHVCRQWHLGSEDNSIAFQIVLQFLTIVLANAASEIKNFFQDEENNVDDTELDREPAVADQAEHQGTEILPVQDENPPHTTQEVHPQREAIKKKMSQAPLKNPIPKKKTRTEMNAPDDSVTQALKLMKDSAQNANDPYISYGLNIAHEMRKYDAVTLACVKHSISNILFQADMGYYRSGYASSVSFNATPNNQHYGYTSGYTPSSITSTPAPSPSSTATHHSLQAREADDGHVVNDMSTGDEVLSQIIEDL